MRYITIMLCVLSNLCAQEPANEQTRGAVMMMSASNAIPLAQLLANPDKFDGKTIVIAGFLNRFLSDGGLYQSEFDWKYGLSLNALHVDFDVKILKKNSYRGPVIIEGVYTKKLKTNLCFAGQITALKVIIPNQTHKVALEQLTERTKSMSNLLKSKQKSLSDLELMEIELLFAAIEAELIQSNKR